MSIDLLVCNYRTPHDLREFLQSYEYYAPHCLHTLRILNVDPTLNDQDVAEEYRERNGNITVTEFETNVGYGHAVNVGASLGGEDTIAIFNADVVLTPGALDACAAMLWKYNETGILGPKQYDQDGKITHAGIFGTPDNPQHRGWRSSDTSKYDDVREAITVSGSAYFVKRPVWEFLTDCPNYQEFAPGVSGAFLETRHWYEETWCSYHAREHGFKILYYGKVSLIHKWHRASRVGGEIDHVVMPESRQIFRNACDHHSIARD